MVMCKWWWLLSMPYVQLLGSWATWQIRLGPRRKMEKHKAENAEHANASYPTTDTINGLQSDETQYDFIPYVWIQDGVFLDKTLPKTNIQSS